MSKDRVGEWDVLRGIAFLAIVMQHALGEYAYRKDTGLFDAYTLAAIYHLVKFGVPAFVLLTGAGLFYNYYNNLNYLAFIKKRSIDILVPYILWTPIYYYFFVRWQKIDFQWLREIGWQLINPTIGYHFWFILMIFQFYILFPVFRKVIIWTAAEKDLSLPGKFNLFLVGTSLIYLFLMWLSYYYLGYHVANYPGFLQYLLINRNLLFIFYSFYFIFGAATAIQLEYWRRIIKKNLLGILLVFGIAYCWTGYELFQGTGFNLPINLNWSTTLKPSMFVLVSSELAGLYMLALLVVQKKARLFRLTSWLGRYSYGAYLVHALILGELIKPLNAIQLKYPDLNQHYVFVTIIVFLLVSFISVLISYTISKIPGGRYLVGPTGSQKKLKNILEAPPNITGIY